MSYQTEKGAVLERLLQLSGDDTRVVVFKIDAFAESLGISPDALVYRIFDLQREGIVSIENRESTGEWKISLRSKNE